MRIAYLVFAGALVAGSVLTAPAQAKNSDAQKGEDKSASSSSCSAYQQAPDGSWEQLPARKPASAASRRPSTGPHRSERMARIAEALPCRNQLWCGPRMIFMASAM